MANEFDDIEAEIDASERKAELEQKLNDLQQQRLEREQKNSEIAKQTAEGLKSQLSNLTGISEQSTTIGGSMTRMLLSSEGIGDAWSKVTKTIGESAKSINNLLSATNILGSLVDTIVSKTKDFLEMQDAVAASFEKSVGNAAKFKGEMFAVYDSTTLYAASLEEVGVVYQSLKSGLTDFENLSSKQRTGMAQTIVQLTKLGVGTDDLIKIQATLHKSMGMSVTQVASLEKQLYATANAMGIPPKTMIKDFADTAPKLAGYGKQMTSVFIDLQDAAKRTGIGISELLQISEKFDTFDSAAESVGKLNAIMGGDYFDTQRLMSLNDAERVKYIQEQLQLNGQSLQDMDRFKQKAMMQALGLKDVAQFQALVNNETGKTGNKLTEQEKAQQRMNSAINTAVTLTERLTAVANEFGLIFGPILTPIVDYIKSISVKIQVFIKDFRSWWKEGGAGVTYLKEQWNTFKTFLSNSWEGYIKPIVNKFLGFFGTDTESLYNVAKGGFDKLPEIIERIKKSIGEIPEKLEKSFPMLGKIIKFFTDMWKGADNTTQKIAMVGGTILGIKGALSIVGKIFGDDEQTQKNNDMSNSLAGSGGDGGIAGAISSIGETITSFSGAFFDFGVAIAGIGVGIGAAAFGISQLVTAFGSLSEEKINQISSAIESMMFNLGVGSAGTGVGIAGLSELLSSEGGEIREWFFRFALAAAAVGAAVGVAAFGISSTIDSLSLLAATEGSAKTISQIMWTISKSIGSLIGEGDAVDMAARTLAFAGLAKVFDDLGDVFEGLGDAIEKGGPILKMFFEAKEENITKFHKLFHKGTMENTLPAFQTIFALAMSSGQEMKKFNDEFERFYKVVEQISDKKIDNIKLIGDIVQKISGQQTRFATIVNGFNSLSQTLASGFAKNLSEGLYSVEVALENFSEQKLQTLERITKITPEEMSLMQQANTIKIETPKDSPLSKIAEALDKGGIEIVLQFDSDKLAKVLVDNSEAARTLMGLLKPRTK